MEEAGPVVASTVEAGTSVPGVLRPQYAADRLTLARYDPPADLAAFLDWFWIVRWDLPPGDSHEQSVLPHPSVHLVFEAHGAHVYGIDSKVFTRRLAGDGKVLGARFRPGCFHPFSRSSVSELGDQVISAARYFGPAAAVASQAIMAAVTDQEMIAIAVSLLREAAPPMDPVAGRVAAMVERITADHELRTVGQLAESFGLNERHLQRLFAEYVGVSPKWVMRRARLHEAAQRADSGEHVDWATLATDLGYSDQSHLTRDFTATIGVPPARYAVQQQLQPQIYQ